MSISVLNNKYNAKYWLNVSKFYNVNNTKWQPFEFAFQIPKYLSYHHILNIDVLKGFLKWFVMLRSFISLVLNIVLHTICSSIIMLMDSTFVLTKHFGPVLQKQ